MGAGVVKSKPKAKILVFLLLPSVIMLDKLRSVKLFNLLFGQSSHGYINQDFDGIIYVVIIFNLFI